jgi:hypothetical protein
LCGAWRGVVYVADGEWLARRLWWDEGEDTPHYECKRTQNERDADEYEAHGDSVAWGRIKSKNIKFEARNNKQI